MPEQRPPDRRGYVLAPGGGRAWPMGPLTATFKADGAESAGRYSVSEWWLEPHTAGPGPHTHPEDDVFYVLEGVVSFLLGDERHEVPTGAFVLAPGGVPHDFENRTAGTGRVPQHLGPGRFRAEHARNQRLVPGPVGRGRSSRHRLRLRLRLDRVT